MVNLKVFCFDVIYHTTDYAVNVTNARLFYIAKFLLPIFNHSENLPRPFL